MSNDKNFYTKFCSFGMLVNYAASYRYSAMYYFYYVLLFYLLFAKSGLLW